MRTISKFQILDSSFGISLPLFGCYFISLLLSLHVLIDKLHYSRNTRGSNDTFIYCMLVVVYSFK